MREHSAGGGEREGHSRLGAGWWGDWRACLLACASQRPLPRSSSSGAATRLAIPCLNLLPPRSRPTRPPARSSVVREFRCVATLTAAQLVTSWIHVSLALGEARDTAERQLAAEQRKKGGGKVGLGLEGKGRWRGPGPAGVC